MPYDEPDETDPMMLVGVELPGDASSAEESCRVLADEFARMGLSEEKLMELFRDPFYTGPHSAFRALGEEKVRAIVCECVGIWGSVCFRDRDVDPESGRMSLPVLDDTSSTSGRRVDHA
jgi:hypothetical protein